MKHTRRLFLMLTLAAGLGAAGAIAWAYFSAPGVGSANASVASLSAPTGVTVPASTTGATVHVTWNGVTAPDGSTVAYWVQRYAGSTPTNACGSSQASPIASGSGAKSCDDTGVTSGTYTYTVTTIFRSWTATSAASGSTVVNASTLDHFTVTAPGSATAGTPISVTVSARDASNNAVTGYTGTVHFSTTDASSPVLPSDYTFVAGDNGSHTFTSAVTLKTAGTQTVSVNDTSQVTKTGTSGTISVAGAGLDHFTVTAPASATAGTSFSTSTVAARDAFGNVASAWTSTTQCVAFSGPANAPSGTAPLYPAQSSCSAGQSSLTFNSSGLASGFAITLYNAQSVALTATASSKTGTSASIVVSGATVDHLAVTAPATATVAAAFTTATVTAQDPYNNPASGWISATKCVTFSGPSNAPNGTAPLYPAQSSCGAGQSSLTFDASAHSSGFSITLYKAENHPLTATDPASSKTGTSGNIVVSSGSALTFVVASPTTATAGTQFTVSSLSARDAYSNAATNYTGTHTIVWTGPSAAPNGTAPTFPTSSVSFTAGVSTTTLNATLVKAESATLNASEASGPSGSISITVSAGTAANFLVTAPATATAGTQFSVTSLTARDSFNNAATSYTGPHTITWSGGANSPDGTAPTRPTTAVTFANGVSTTTLTATLVKAENATLTASAASPTVSGGASITVNAAAASDFALTNCTVNTVSKPCAASFALGNGGTMTAQITVTDAYGNTPANTTVTINLSSSNTNNYTVTTPVQITNGVTSTASFTVQKLGNASNSATITAHATSGSYTDLTFGVSK